MNVVKRLFRWIHWRARSRYWRHRALRAEAQLEAERWRNSEREDTLITVPMRLGGLWGMPARSGPAPTKQVSRIAPAPPVTATDPWIAQTTPEERWEFDLYWKQDAQAAGYSDAQAKQEFMRRLQERKQLIDDPTMLQWMTK